MTDPAPTKPARRKRDRDGVFDRGDGWLWLQHKGRRVSLKTKDRACARVAAAELKRRAADPAHVAACLTTVERACCFFRKYAPTSNNRPRPPSPETLAMQEVHFKHFRRIFGAGTPLSKLDAGAVDDYIATRRGERVGKAPPTGALDRRRLVKASTVDKELGTLRQILRLGLRRGWYHLPLERVLPTSAGGEYVPLDRALSWEEVPKLLAELQEGRAATCAFLIAFGADWCAVERARLEDLGGVDWCSRLVLVRGTKNRERWAEVPVVEPFGALADQARAYLAAHGAFPAWGKQRVRDLAAACRRAGVPRVTPRDLRRTHGQVLAERGVPPHLIGDMLRHTDGRMAERVYGRRSREAVGRQVAAITRRLR